VYFTPFGTAIGYVLSMHSIYKYTCIWIFTCMCRLVPLPAQDSTWTGTDTLLISYQDAINIALEESFSIKSHIHKRDAMHHYYGYYKATFKPRFDVSLNTPLWSEYVNQIDQPDGLPVYNSYGSFQMGGSTKFTYVLPTGGDVAFSTNLYQEDLKTVLASDGEVLKNTQFYSRFWLSFNQPLFTRNQLKENLNEAGFMYEKAIQTFTRNQRDIVYEVSRGF